MRFAVLGLSHEANTFSPEIVSADALAQGTVRGDEILLAHRDGQTTIAGFLQAAREAHAAAVPIVYAWVTPSGPIARDAYDSLTDEMVVGVLHDSPWDGVLLALHGAGVAEGQPDVELDVLTRVREAVGPAVPIGVGFDMHANLDARMAGLADVMIGYRTNPHVDARRRGAEVGRLVIAAARGERRPVTAIRPLPAVIDILRQGTQESPMRELVELVERAELRPGVLSASIVEGYPYADVPPMGMSVVVVADSDRAVAEAEAERIAVAVWERRGDFTAEGTPVDEAIERVARAHGRPVLLLDVGDNVGGGAPGDSAVLPLAALRRSVAPILCVLVDPGAASAAHEAGVGERLTLALRDADDATVPVEGEIAALGDGRFEETVTSHGGQRFYDAGSSAAVRLPDGSILVVSTHRVIPSSLRQLTDLGVDPARFRAIVAKGVNSPLAAYGPIADEIVFVDTPGITSSDLSRFEYRSRRRPLHPFEEVNLPGEAR